MLGILSPKSNSTVTISAWATSFEASAALVEERPLLEAPTTRLAAGALDPRCHIHAPTATTRAAPTARPAQTLFLPRPEQEADGGDAAEERERLIRWLTQSESPGLGRAQFKAPPRSRG